MLRWSICNLKHFLELSKFIMNHRKYYNTMIFKYSSTSFSMMVSASPYCITELQIMPEFFVFFFCSNRTFQYATISVANFFRSLFLIEHNACTIMSFSLPNDMDDHLLDLTFYTHDDRKIEAYLPLLLSYQEFDVGEIDYGWFVSIESHHFLACLTMLGSNGHVRVSMINSQLIFASRTLHLILQPERGDCIIGGVEEAEIICFSISIDPIVPFYSLIRSPKAKRVWLFKSNNDFAVTVIPVDLYAQYLVHTN
ncbi:hypothetical protein IC582_027098 [Cucumis melo]